LVLKRTRGKTATAGGADGLSLLIVPASLVANWRAEIQKFAPSLAVFYAQPSETPNEALIKAGIQRRGIILAFLTRFKQICNHPSQWLGDGVYAFSESGKFNRMAELCEGIAARQEKVLVFTQYRESRWLPSFGNRSKPNAPPRPPSRASSRNRWRNGGSAPKPELYWQRPRRLGGCAQKTQNRNRSLVAGQAGSRPGSRPTWPEFRSALFEGYLDPGLGGAPLTRKVLVAGFGRVAFIKPCELRVGDIEASQLQIPVSYGFRDHMSDPIIYAIAGHHRQSNRWHGTKSVVARWRCDWLCRSTPGGS
jgi:hypothetical protein